MKGGDIGGHASLTHTLVLLLFQLSKKSFPLCMQQLHTALRSNHHLRHGGRQQYGLFLKGIGLSLDEAIKFWRSEFTKIIDGDQVGCKVVVMVMSVS